MDKITVFLTGATGTMGFAGLQELLKFPERYHIRVLARDSKKNRKLLAPFADCIEIIWGDLCRYEDVLRGVCGSDIVLHTGGLVSPKADYLPEATRKINLGAAENIRDDPGRNLKQNAHDMKNRLRKSNLCEGKSTGCKNRDPGSRKRKLCEDCRRIQSAYLFLYIKHDNYPFCSKMRIN